jgi:outer membrane protein assembly factor BamB
VSTLPILFALLASPAQEPAWPDYRGPNLDGQAPAGAELPIDWSEEANVAWKTALWGRGWSSPVVADGRAWMTTADEDGHRLAVLCVDVNTGEVLLDRLLFEVEEPMNRNDLNSYASPSPVVGGGLLFGSAGIACLDTATLETVWARRDLLCAHLMGPGSSPLMVDDQVVVVYDGADVQYLVSLDLEDGETRWRTERSIDFGGVDGDLRKAYGTPVLVQDGERRVLVSTGARATYGYDLRDGAELWRVGHVGFSMSARPVVCGDRVLVNTGFMRAELWALDLGGEGDVTETHVGWKINKGIPTMSTGVVVGGRVYQVSDGGIVHCFDLETGERIWRERVVGGVCSSLLAAGERIYVFDKEGSAVVFAAEDQLRILGESQLEQGCMASPAVVGEALLVRTKTHLYRLENVQEGAR